MLAMLVDWHDAFIALGDASKKNERNDTLEGERRRGQH